MSGVQFSSFSSFHPPFPSLPVAAASEISLSLSLRAVASFLSFGGSWCSVCGTHNQIDLLSLVSPTRPIKSRRRRRRRRRKTPKTTAMMPGRRGPRSRSPTDRTLHSTYGVKDPDEAQLQLFPRGRDELGNDNETNRDRPRPSVPPFSVRPPGPVAVRAVRAW